MAEALPLLQVTDLHVSRENHEILRGLDLAVQRGTVHAVLGLNGSGKSTLAYTLMALAGYRPSQGRILLDGHDITDLGTTERAKLGLTLAWLTTVLVSPENVWVSFSLWLLAGHLLPLRLAGRRPLVGSARVQGEFSGSEHVGQRRAQDRQPVSARPVPLYFNEEMSPELAPTAGPRVPQRHKA